MLSAAPQATVRAHQVGPPPCPWFAWLAMSSAVAWCRASDRRRARREERRRHCVSVSCRRCCCRVCLGPPALAPKVSPPSPWCWIKSPDHRSSSPHPTARSAPVHAKGISNCRTFLPRKFRCCYMPTSRVLINRFIFYLASLECWFWTWQSWTLHRWLQCRK